MKRAIHLIFGFIATALILISGYAALTDDIWFAFKMTVLALNSVLISALASNTHNGKNSNKESSLS